MSVAHLRDLYETFRGRGFDIIALTNEDPVVVSRFVRLQDPDVVYPVGIGARHPYGSGGIPHAKLVGVDGTVVWEGHPARLTDDIVEAELLKVRRFADVEGKRARKAGKELDRGNFGKALAEAEKILAGDRADAVDVASAKEIVLAVGAEAERKLAWADALAAEGRLDRASEILDEMESSFSRSGYADRAGERRKALEGDGPLGELAEARDTVEKLLSRSKPPIRGDDREAVRRALEKRGEGFEGQPAREYISRWLTILSEDWTAKR